MGEKKRPMRRREFVQFMAAVSAGGTFFGNTVLMMSQDDKKVTREMVMHAEELAGVRFTEAQRDMMIPTLQNYLQNIQKIREMSIPPEVAPALYFLSDTPGIWTLTPKKIKEG